jgi:hypothetical protein
MKKVEEDQEEEDESEEEEEEEGMSFRFRSGGSATSSIRGNKDFLATGVSQPHIYHSSPSNVSRLSTPYVSSPSGSSREPMVSSHRSMSHLSGPPPPEMTFSVLVVLDPTCTSSSHDPSTSTSWTCISLPKSTFSQYRKDRNLKGFLAPCKDESHWQKDHDEVETTVFDAVRCHSIFPSLFVHKFHILACFCSFSSLKQSSSCYIHEVGSLY